MRFAVSLLSWRPGRVGGTETYLRELLRHLAAEAGGDEIVAVAHPEALAGLEARGVGRVVVPRGDLALVGERAAEAFGPYRARAVERAFAALRADALLFPQQSVFPKRVAGRVVLTVLDLQHLFHPGNFGSLELAFRRALYPGSLRRADRVIAISAFTRQSLLDRCGLAPAQVRAVPLGFSPPPEAGELAPLPSAPEPYLYFPAASYPHKDHATLFESYAALRERRAIADRLVLSGERTAWWPRLRRLARRLGIERDVVHLGFLPRAEVERVYAHARAVVFPSRYEGFGLPVLEAAARRKPVVTRPLPVYAELGLGPEWQIDFGDPDALLAALRQPGPTVLSRPPSSWAECARGTLAVLREAARGAGAAGP